MTLTNSQFDSIQREYDAAQLKNRQLLEKRRQEVFARGPAYEEAASEVASLSVRFGKRMLAETMTAAQDGQSAQETQSAQEVTSAEAYHEAL